MDISSVPSASYTKPMTCLCCQQELSDIHVKCHSCGSQTEPTLLCVECFSFGVEFGEHRKDHEYSLCSSKRHVPVFIGSRVQPWLAVEETKLLDNVEHAGFGNWRKVSAELGKAEGLCEEHYTGFYTVVDHTGHESGAARQPDAPVAEGTDVGSVDPPPPVTPVAPGAPSSLSSEQAEQSKTVGYLHLRDDFEVEFDSDAERSISTVRLRHDDEQIDTDVHLSQIDSFRRRLMHRQTRKHVARSYGMIATLFGTAPRPLPDLVVPSKRTLNEMSAVQAQSANESLRAISQFIASDQLSQLAENLQTERALHARVRELQRARKANVTRLSDVGGKAQNSSAVSSQSSASSVLPLSGKRRGSSKALKRKGGTIGGGSPSAAKNKKWSSEEEQQANPSRDSATNIGSAARGRPTDRSSVARVSSGSGADSGVMGRARRFSARIIDQMPSFPLLTPQEKTLCRLVGLTPATYVSIKTCILKDGVRALSVDQQGGTLAGAFDKHTYQQIANFLSDCGWLTR